MSSQLVADYSS